MLKSELVVIRFVSRLKLIVCTIKRRKEALLKSIINPSMKTILKLSNPTIFLLNSTKAQYKNLSLTSKTTPIPTQDHISRLILEQKTATQVLKTFRWASEIPNFTHSNSTYRALVHKLCTFRRFEIVHKVLDEMPSSIGSNPDEAIFVTFIRGLGRAGMVKEAVNVLGLLSKFEKIPSLKIYNSILDVLVKEDIDIAKEFYRKKMMECGVRGDEYTFGILMKGLCLTNRIDEGFKLLATMKFYGVTANTVIYNTLINGICKNGKVGRARSLMNEIAEPNEVTYNIVISAYCREGDFVQALVMLGKSLDNDIVPDIVTVTKVVEMVCNKGRVNEAVEVLERVESKGGVIDVVAYNTLIKGFCKAKKASLAIPFLKKMEIKGCLPNIDTYNILIKAFCDSRNLDMALEMFHEMKRAGVRWNFVTFDTLIAGLCSEVRTEDGFKILELMEESKGGSGGRISVYNSIIYGLYKENRLNEAYKYLSYMGKLFPRAVERSLKIFEFCENGNVKDAKSVFDLMIGEGDFPSALVYAKLIDGFCENGRVKEALEMMSEMIGRGYFPVVSTCNGLLSRLCKQGNLLNAFELLEDIVKRDFVPNIESYNPLIEGFCRNGDFEKGFSIFLAMLGKGIVPDYSTWESLVVSLYQENLSVVEKSMLTVGNDVFGIHTCS